jgi:hypothetical protein
MAIFIFIGIDLGKLWGFLLVAKKRDVIIRKWDVDLKEGRIAA